MPLAEGTFVRTLFPTDEMPRQPGLLHICYCLGVTPVLAVVAYSTSRAWPAGVPLPQGVRVFGPTEAAALRQRPFVLHLNRVARLPLTRRWFPGLDAPDQGVIAEASPALRDELLALAENLLRRRRETIRLLGPFAG